MGKKDSNMKNSEQEEMEADLNSSNVAILPASRKNKSKGKEKGLKRKNEAPALSKSKQRKLRKLEEEKQQKVLHAKSIELLGKYKISDNAFSFLHSSGTIGKTETVKEKRRRAVEFSKAGFEIPEEISVFKKKNLPESSGSFQEKEDDDEREIEGKSVLPVLKACEGKKSIEEDQNTEFEKSSINPPISNPDSNLEREDQKTEIQKQDSNPQIEISNSNLPTEKTTKMETQKSENKITEIIKKSNPIIAPIVVQVKRPAEIEEKRKDLPIIMMEQEIMEAINENSVVIICGETGCGKTTQVPQFLYEAGYGSSTHPERRGVIGITQPRRVAVLSTAKRVTHELGLKLGKEVGFQVRHDKMIGKDSSIKFMTDGILLREVQSDFLLKRFSVIILDEAHERSLNTDILIGMLSRIIKIRQTLFMEQQEKIKSGVKISQENLISELKLILMSATLRVEDFQLNKKLFEMAPPVIEVPVRQFPVTVHFSKRTHDDYLGQAYKKVISIHKKLPPGGILVFVTGQREVEHLCRKLHKASRRFIERKEAAKKEESVGPTNADVDNNGMKEISEAFDVEKNEQQEDRFNPYDEEEDQLPDRNSNSSDSDSNSEFEFETDSEFESEDEEEASTIQPSETNNNKILDFLNDKDSLSFLKSSFDSLSNKTNNNNNSSNNNNNNDNNNNNNKNNNNNNNKTHYNGLHILPLYAMLPASQQLRVFSSTPQHKRLIVISTNVAETSLTIPGIKYVVDTGKQKVKTYQHSNGIAKYEVTWISKASASQRAGRAGRTGPGHCYRLYSGGAFGKEDVFPEFEEPEIMKLPVEGVVLLMKFMGIDKVVNFPFPTPPEKAALTEAENCLKALQVLDNQNQLTPIGRAMAQFPMTPRHSKMLLTSIRIIMTSSHHADVIRPELTLAYSLAATSALSFPNPFLFNFREKEKDKDDSIDKDELDKKRAKESFLQFSNNTCDALTIAIALHEFEITGNRAEFCRENSLHLKNLEDMSKLRKQLLRLAFQNSNSFETEFKWTGSSIEQIETVWIQTKSESNNNKNPLRNSEEEIIAQAICAGWVDRVAKRVRAREISDPLEKDRKLRAIRYQSCALKDLVYLNKSSHISRFAPEFLAYTELVQTKRPYMHGVTAVKSEWLVNYGSALCTFSSPLLDPKPFYDPLRDEVFNWVSPSFGPHNWQLNLHFLPIKKREIRVSVFACALLEGQVLPCVKNWQKCLVGPASSILKNEYLGQKRVGNLLNRLKNGTKFFVDSRVKLREIWSDEPSFLYEEIESWFQEKFRERFEELWSEMKREVLLEGRELFPKRGKKGKK
ncbi:hypothetical protein LUZ60_009198 [Juncus effusus]|nr:hypothetical protein LUZ60_009198 [Juncus effusus]